MHDYQGLKASEFVRKVKRHGANRQLNFRWVPSRGKGSHGTLYLGENGRTAPSEECALNFLSTQRIFSMFLFQYPASLERYADGEVIVRFPDLRGTITRGVNEAEALAAAADLLGSAIAHSIAEKEPIPPPSALKRGQRLVAVPFWIAGKLAIYQAIQEAGITNVELARRLGVT